MNVQKVSTVPWELLLQLLAQLELGLNQPHYMQPMIAKTVQQATYATLQTLQIIRSIHAQLVNTAPHAQPYPTTAQLVPTDRLLLAVSRLIAPLAHLVTTAPRALSTQSDAQMVLTALRDLNGTVLVKVDTTAVKQLTIRSRYALLTISAHSAQACPRIAQAD